MGLSESVRASSGLDALDLRRRRFRNHIIPTSMSAPQKPPTTPPAIAPLFVDDPDPEEAADVVAAFKRVSRFDPYSEMTAMWKKGTGTITYLEGCLAVPQGSWFRYLCQERPRL